MLEFHQNASSTSLVNLFFFFIFLFFLPPSSSQRSRYDDCAPLECGGITISYPFRDKSQPHYCGNHGFELSCDNRTNNPVLLLDRDSYYVNEIDYQDHRLLIVNKDFVANACPLPNRNITLQSFSFTPKVRYLYLYSNCTDPIGNPSFSLISCISRHTPGRYVYYTEGNGKRDEKIFENCGDPVVVPVREKSAWALQYKKLNYSAAVERGFRLAWHADGCEACQSSGGRCGNSGGSLPLFSCFCSDREYPNECLSPAGVESVDRKTIIGAVAGSIGGIIVAIVFSVLRWKSRFILTSQKQKTENTRNVEEFLKDHGSHTPKRCSYSDIMKITNSMKDKLGEGGFGSVYKGKLLDGRLVAVKILCEAKGDGEDFMNEVASISRTAHVNIVSLLGFCSKGSKRALIYDFMSNGSLEKFIFSENPKHHSLSWEILFRIALGIARGLEYLHRGCSTRILHLDIKPHNILLDQDFCPKISDFGLAKLYPEKQSAIWMTRARGTTGYMAPEVYSRNFGGVSYKSDVYSYGMLILEIVGGRKNIDASVENTSEIYYPAWVYDRIEQNGDLQLGELTSETDDEMARKMIIVGLWCIQIMAVDRPSMSKVVEMLEGSLQGLPTPPKPFPSSSPE